MQDLIVSAPALSLLAAMDVLQRCEKFPLSVLPHLILFFAGDKPAARLVLEEPISSALQASMEALGHSCAVASVYVSQVGSHWGKIGTHDDLRPEVEVQRVLVLGTTRVLAASVLEKELAGDSREAGAALGYPACCVAAYPSLADRPEEWPAVLMARSAMPMSASQWCNRLASLWGGTCPTGELFPCDLHCAEAIQTGKRADALLREHGFSLIADEILAQASRPIHWLDNEVVIAAGTVSGASEIQIHA